VVPQLIAKIDFGKSRSCDLAVSLLLRVFKDFPDQVIFPVILSATAEGRRRKTKSLELLSGMSKLNPILVEQGHLVSKELWRVAKEQWLTCILSFWELYLNYCDGQKNVRLKLLTEVKEFHKKVSNPETM